MDSSLTWQSTAQADKFHSSLLCFPPSCRRMRSRTNRNFGFIQISALHGGVKEREDRFPTRKIASLKLESAFYAAAQLHEDGIDEFDKRVSFTYPLLWFPEPFQFPDMQLLGLVKANALYLDSGNSIRFLPSEGHPTVNLMRCNTATTLRQKVQEQDSTDYHVNIGYAIRTLKDELPVVFYREMTYNIYREDIVFRDPHNFFQGIGCYKCIFWSLGFCGRFFFKTLWMDVIRVWQPSDNIIMVRWAVHGVPRIPWEVRGRFDGVSEYKLDKEGKIYEHKVDNVLVNKPPKSTCLTVVDFSRFIVCDAQPTPTVFQEAGSFFFFSLACILRPPWFNHPLGPRR